LFKEYFENGSFVRLEADILNIRQISFA